MTTDYEVRSWLVAFFGWKPAAVMELEDQVVVAWGKHYAALERVGFLTASTKTGEAVTVTSNSGLGWCGAPGAML